MNRNRWCNHTETRIMGVGNENNPHAWLTCQNCGQHIGKAMTMPLEARLALPYDDNSIYERFLQQIRDEIPRAELNLPVKKSNYAKYKGYLKSKRWRDKREKVLLRCGGKCEGCGEAKVYHVHHLTYDNFGDELLFQLVGLCENCHRKCHKGKS